VVGPDRLGDLEDDDLSDEKSMSIGVVQMKPWHDGSRKQAVVLLLLIDPARRAESASEDAATVGP